MKKTFLMLVTAAGVLVTPLFAAEIRYAYDERRQLTSVVRDGRDAFGYGYDLAGNLRWASIGCKTNVYESNCLNQYTTVTDGDGNVHHLAYDEDGNLIEDARFMYSWDSAGRLKEAISSSLDGGVAINNHYDAFGRRVQKDVYLLLSPDRKPQTRDVSTTRYFYDGTKLVLEQIETADGHVYQTEYFWGKDLSGTLDGADGVGGLLYVKVDGVPYVPLYGISNIEAYCNTNGQIVAGLTYSPYGQMVSGHGPPALFRRLHIWFSTKYLDHETSLYYFGKRFYSPFLCRWLNQDPRGESGGINLYAFCCNNPVNNFDPDGCAYFAKRRIHGGKFQNLAAKVLQCPFVSDLADSGNFEIAHEQLFYEDGSGNIGWGMDADETGRGDFMRNEPYDGYVTREGGYNDCIMHIAEGLVGRPDHYQAWTGPKSKCNCQDYCDKLRNKYNEIKNSQEVRCKCKLPIIVR